MKSKIFVVGISMFLLSHLSIGNTIDKFESNYEIVYLNYEKHEQRKLLPGALNKIILDEKEDAYVLDKSSFEKLEKESVDEYLKQGGVLVVNDNDVNSDDLAKIVKTKVAPFDYKNLTNQYGFYVFNNSRENIVVNVSLGYLNSEKSNQLNIVENNISENVLVEDIVDLAFRDMQMSVIEPNNVAGGSPIQTTTSGQVVAYGILENLLYRINGGNLVCSYTIYTQVYDVAKVNTTGSYEVKGIYDVVSSFTVDAESGWAVTDYKVRMKTESSILDSTYLYSNATTTVSMGGSAGFQGSELSGDVNWSVSYSFNGQSQEIINDLPAGNTKYWKATPVTRTKNSSYILKPAIRLVNSNDIYSTNEYSRVETFNISDLGWWIFENKLYMGNQYRKEMKIAWNSFGFLSQSTIIG